MYNLIVQRKSYMYYATILTRFSKEKVFLL